MSEPIDIDELRRNLAHDTASPTRAMEYCDRMVPQLLDALAALRIAAEPYNRWLARKGTSVKVSPLREACQAVKLPEGAGK